MFKFNGTVYPLLNPSSTNKLKHFTSYTCIYCFYSSSSSSSSSSAPASPSSSSTTTTSTANQVRFVPKFSDVHRGIQAAGTAATAPARRQSQWRLSYSRTASGDGQSTFKSSSSDALEGEAMISSYESNKKRVMLGKLLLWFFGVSALTGTFPLIYRRVCMQQAGGIRNDGMHKTVAPMMPDDERTKKRLIQVDFTANVLGNLKWNFKPSQKRLIVTPGETALAFFTAENFADKPVMGYAMYTVDPPEFGSFFSKVQCFCFEEQLLAPGELVDLPVLFYIEPNVINEFRLNHVDRCTLMYVFYETFSEIPEEYLKIPYVRQQLEVYGHLPKSFQVSETAKTLEA